MAGGLHIPQVSEQSIEVRPFRGRKEIEDLKGHYPN